MMVLCCLTAMCDGVVLLVSDVMVLPLTGIQLKYFKDIVIGICKNTWHA